jgi:hypothetical protein
MTLQDRILILAMYVAEQPKDNDENNNSGDHSTAEFPRDQPGETSARWSIH